jgi:hypothetical protein
MRGPIIALGHPHLRRPRFRSDGRFAASKYSLPTPHSVADLSTFEHNGLFGPMAQMVGMVLSFIKTERMRLSSIHNAIEPVSYSPSQLEAGAWRSRRFALDKAILHRLAGRDVVTPDLVLFLASETAFEVTRCLCH